VLLIDGKVVPHCLARIPARATRAATSRGARGVAQPSARATARSPRRSARARRRGLLLVGLDVIGDWLTE